MLVAKLLHELGENAVLSESGHGAYLVQQELSVFGEEEVDSCKALAA